MEQVLQIIGDRDAYFWATQSGAELDLMVLWHGQRIGFKFHLLGYSLHQRKALCPKI